MPKSANERKARERENRRNLGLRRLELYVHPDDAAKVRAYAQRLQRRRAAE